MTTLERSSNVSFWTIAALAIIGSVSAFAFAGAIVFFPDGIPSRQMIDAPPARSNVRLRSPVHFERNHGPSV